MVWSADTNTPIGCGSGGRPLLLASLLPNEIVLGMEIRAKHTEYVRLRIVVARKEGVHDDNKANIGTTDDEAKIQLLQQLRRDAHQLHEVSSQFLSAAKHQQAVLLLSRSPFPEESTQFSEDLVLNHRRHTQGRCLTSIQ